MAEVPVVRILSRENISESPGWIVKLIQPLNLIIESLTGALSNRLTFGENISAQQHEVTFTTLSNYTSGTDGWEILRFNNNLGTKGLMLMIAEKKKVGDNYEAFTVPIDLDWREIAGVIRIEYISGIANSTKYKFKFILVI